MDTIFALATAAGRAGIALIRISGPAARKALERLTGRSNWTPRYAHRVTLSDPETGQEIDQGLAIYFAAPHSFTGEDVVELHVHGGTAIVESLMTVLRLQLDLRLALPGEFTRRAFENGKLDLTQAEAIADLIDAESPAQLAQALRQKNGDLSRFANACRADILHASAYLTADIDFPDEALDSGLACQARAECESLATRLAAELAQAWRGDRVRNGYRIVLLGAPNVGKSSLVNALTRQDRSIVSALPGTTRDFVESRLILAGHVVWLVDSAGLREPGDDIEREGIARAVAQAEIADLRLLIGVPGETMPPFGLCKSGDIIVYNQCDRAGWDRPPPDPDAASSRPDWFVGDAARQTCMVSAHTRQGLEGLVSAIEDRVRADLSGSEHAALTNQRHIAHVTTALNALQRAIAQLPGCPEMAAEDLRVASFALAQLTGTIGVEEVLGVIFSRFCIGK